MLILIPNRTELTDDGERQRQMLSAKTSKYCTYSFTRAQYASLSSLHMKDTKESGLFSAGALEQREVIYLISYRKEIIRSRLLESAINEPDGRVALQISIMISKVIRHEFPHDWPDPISSMLQTLHQKLEPSKNPVHVSRILLVLLYVIKELSTSRLQRPRKALQSVTPKIISALSLAYNTKVRSWLSFLHNGGNDEGGALDSVEQSLLALRALRRLIISGT